MTDFTFIFLNDPKIVCVVFSSIILSLRQNICFLHELALEANANPNAFFHKSLAVARQVSNESSIMNKRN